MDWFEIISENYFAEGGIVRANLEAVRASYRLVPHGVSLSIGGSEPLDPEYLRRLRALVRRIEAPWCSDHLCWTGAGGVEPARPSSRAVHAGARWRTWPSA